MPLFPVNTKINALGYGEKYFYLKKAHRMIDIINY